MPEIAQEQIFRGEVLRPPAHPGRHVPACPTVSVATPLHILVLQLFNFDLFFSFLVFTEC
jgi:hypothetical protein